MTEPDPTSGVGLGAAPSPWSKPEPPPVAHEEIWPLPAMRLGIPALVLGMLAFAVGSLLDGDRDPRLFLGLITVPILAALVVAAAWKEHIVVDGDELRVIRLRSTQVHRRADVVAVSHRGWQQPPCLVFATAEATPGRILPGAGGPRQSTARIPMLQTSRTLARRLGVDLRTREGDPVHDRWYRLRDGRGRIRWLPWSIAALYGALFLIVFIAWIVDVATG